MAQKDDNAPSKDEVQKNLRRKNLAVLLMLAGFCAILYISIILRQQGL